MCDIVRADDLLQCGAGLIDPAMVWCAICTSRPSFHAHQRGSDSTSGGNSVALLGREFIAAPNSSKGQIVFKWSDHNIRKFTRCIVEPDAVAVFMSQGQVMGTLLGGQHQLDAKELPFLGMFVDWATNSNAFKAELYFVGIRDFPNLRFGGRLDEVQDPVTGLIVTLRTFGPALENTRRAAGKRA